MKKSRAVIQGVMKTTARFDARKVRDALLARGGPNEDGFRPIRLPAFRYSMALLGSGIAKLLDRKRRRLPVLMCSREMCGWSCRTRRDPICRLHS